MTGVAAAGRPARASERPPGAHDLELLQVRGLREALAIADYACGDSDLSLTVLGQKVIEKRYRSAIGVCGRNNPVQTRIKNLVCEFPSQLDSESYSAEHNRSSRKRSEARWAERLGRTPARFFPVGTDRTGRPALDRRLSGLFRPKKAIRSQLPTSPSSSRATASHAPAPGRSSAAVQPGPP